MEPGAFTLRSIPSPCFIFYFEAGSHQVAKLPRLGLPSRPSCLSLPGCWDDRPVPLLPACPSSWRPSPVFPGAASSEGAGRGATTAGRTPQVPIWAERASPVLFPPLHWEETRTHILVPKVPKGDPTPRPRRSGSAVTSGLQGGRKVLVCLLRPCDIAVGWRPSGHQGPGPA